jgi:ABC-2 type transport system permease protein
VRPLELHTELLWKQRFEQHAKETMGYWQYAARSNFIGFLLFLIIVSSYYYAKTLQHLPTNYPYFWIAALVIIPLLVLSPIRTLLRMPDRMFLLRAELQMNAYFRGGFLYSLGLQTFVVFLALAALWPLYRHCEIKAAQPYLLMLVFLLLIKAANLLASWKESRFVHVRTRIFSMIYRWIATGMILWLLFMYSAIWAGGASLIAILIWLPIFIKVDQYQVNWEYLIEKEKQQQARLYAFFNWFIDVPQLSSKIRYRSWISGIAERLPFHQKSTYSYLYTKTLIRTELFGIILRITLIGALAIFVLSSDAARSVVFFVIILISTVQLSSLGQAHRYNFWLDMYPLDRSRKAGTLARIVWSTLLAQTCLLAIPFFVRASFPYAIVPLLSLVLCTFTCLVILRRKFQAS